MKKNKEINSKKYVDLMGTVGTVGMHMVSHPAVGAVLGYFLDDWLGTKPWFFVGGLLLGVIAGFKAVIMDTMKIARNQGKERDQRDKQQD